MKQQQQMIQKNGKYGTIDTTDIHTQLPRLSGCIGHYKNISIGKNLNFGSFFTISLHLFQYLPPPRSSGSATLLGSLWVLVPSLATSQLPLLRVRLIRDHFPTCCFWPLGSRNTLKRLIYKNLNLLRLIDCN